ncbi:MAG: hypothetical protein V4456_11330 [Bacteroidota bacterium]
MTWGKFLMIVFIVYLVYYAVVFLMDMMKGGPNARVATDEGHAIDITGVDEDHVTENLEEFTGDTPGAGISRTTEVYTASKQVEEPDATTTIMQPVIAKGFSLKELADAAKSGAIELTRGIAFQ